MDVMLDSTPKATRMTTWTGRDTTGPCDPLTCRYVTDNVGRSFTDPPTHDLLLELRDATGQTIVPCSLNTMHCAHPTRKPRAPPISRR